MKEKVKLVGIMVHNRTMAYHLSLDRDRVASRFCELPWNMGLAGRVRLEVDDPYSLMLDMMVEASTARKWYSDRLRGLSVRRLIDMTCPECLACIGIDRELIRRLREL